MRLLLLTSGFPYGSGEQFLESEIGMLSDRFDQIDIVPFRYGLRSTPERSVPANCRVHLDLTEAAYHAFGELHREKYLNVLRRRRYVHAVHFVANRLRVRPITNRELIDRQLFSLCLADGLERAGLVPDVDVAYSYWAVQPALALSYLKRTYPNMKTVTRAHGYDVFSERENRNHLPFYPEMLTGMDAVFTCSDMTRAYLAKKYPRHARKIRRSYLGVREGERGPIRDDGILKVVSCSRLASLKRVDAIARAIAGVKRPVHWTHIGDGEERDVLMHEIGRMPESVVTEMIGHVSNDEVLSIFRDRPFDVFVNFSTTEALPVTLMEAMSYGIPCIAPAIGGITELIDESCGWILPADASEEDLTRLLNEADFASVDKRQAAIARQRELFDAEKNYRAFCDELTSIAIPTGAEPPDCPPNDVPDSSEIRI